MPKNEEKLEIVKSFLAIFAKSTGHKDAKICTVHHINIPYKCSFIKMSLSKKKSKLKIVPTTTTTTQTTTTSTVPWSGLRRRKKGRNDLQGIQKHFFSRVRSGGRDESLLFA